jgi:hypothetical protein
MGSDECEVPMVHLGRVVQRQLTVKSPSLCCHRVTLCCHVYGRSIPWQELEEGGLGLSGSVVCR